MVHKDYTKTIWKKQDIAWLIAGVLAIGIFLGVALCCTVALISEAQAEELTYRCWVMCRPGSEVMVRERPDRSSPCTGAVVCGEELRTDWKEKNGWLHLVGLANETGEGWVHQGYVVFTEPKKVDEEWTVTGGRVACRKCIEGRRTAWAKSGSRVKVYLVADEWAVTDRGYIMKQYLQSGSTR